MAQQVMLHVGAPKTGTSFVQDICFNRREDLLATGISYPADRFDAHFLAALDLMQLPWGGLEAQADGCWERLAAQVRVHDGTAIISHEILGRASRQQAAKALADFGDAEVHLVVSVRDLVRQIPAEWQENIKHRRTKSYANFLADLQDPTRPSQISQWFWSVQEIPDVIDRWSTSLPPERIHIVTVPRPGAPRELLWQRFAGLFGIDSEQFAPESTRANQSLGVAETALVRRLNTALNATMPGEDYRPVVRELLVHQNLAAHRGSPRLELPPGHYEWAAQLSRIWAAHLAESGFDIVGDLADLEPDPPAEFVDPDHPDEALVAAAAERGLVGYAEEIARQRAEIDRIHADNADLKRQIDELHATVGYRAKEKAYRTLTSSRAGRAVLGLTGRER